jgi:hypothetical protein
MLSLSSVANGWARRPTVGLVDERRIRWAPMPPAHKLVALYEANAQGLDDGELLDDVGWRLWERLVDVLRVTSGRVRCPARSTEFQVRTPNREPDEAVPCPGDDWQITPRQWHAGWRHRGLNGRCEEFERYAATWAKARTARDRMLLIDVVVHALHVASHHDIPGNFAARNFLEGSRPKIVALLHALDHGPGSNIATDARARWQTARDHYATHRRAHRASTLPTRPAQPEA